MLLFFFNMPERYAPKIFTHYLKYIYEMMQWKQCKPFLVSGQLSRDFEHDTDKLLFKGPFVLSRL